MSVPYNLQTNDPNSMIVQMDIEMERAITSLETAGIHDPGSLTVFQFNQRVDYLKEKKPKENA